ncbi:enoyl-CoA hydratase/isomerase family protein [Mycobacterium sp. CVI_P3]|uniref:Enoyl-CoA hydratase/isomerase family protein n=1 Tax=Mycobacterium pinniadriaticum TaxID=2994102 RepID=A0ABT3SF50_9MYCO|nr:enoyl-CoA hydratase/isomerase family protein [Mycobacterium pinniadriaticum]MCX2931805.1 enoyl-CoA hydratase/isomerase family protein [Mycobacterium pinniadriaticum]MCX2938120.1 enoyl-CoA hydratase/isomerase family protein [Mycobacterium pinniadriaticum]
MNIDTGHDVVTAELTDAGILVATLNRPSSRNSLILESWLALDAALDYVTAAGDVRCVVLTSVGAYFSSGGDLKTAPRVGNGAMAAIGRLEVAHGVITRLRSLPVPVFCAVEGGAVGLGWSLALACDLVVAARGARFSCPFVRRGVVPDGGASWFLSQRVGRIRAAALVLLGTELTAVEAHECGLISHLADDGASLAVAMELAGKLAESPSRAVELTKRLLHSAEDSDFVHFLALELATGVITQGRPEAAAARAAFAARSTATASGPTASPPGAMAGLDTAAVATEFQFGDSK